MAEIDRVAINDITLTFLSPDEKEIFTSYRLKILDLLSSYPPIRDRETAEEILQRAFDEVPDSRHVVAKYRRVYNGLKRTGRDQ